eukprot:GHVN01064689.1.p1 GENE.GHVN01064689.1~~GHVN01064689.1.p1  ORF type:complete len:259 (+),score=45.47 GHVN01064689.1:290-1066(+)
MQRLILLLALSFYTVTSHSHVKPTSNPSGKPTVNPTGNPSGNPRGNRPSRTSLSQKKVYVDEQGHDAHPDLDAAFEVQMNTRCLVEVSDLLKYDVHGTERSETGLLSGVTTTSVAAGDEPYRVCGYHCMRNPICGGFIFTSRGNHCGLLKLRESAHYLTNTTSMSEEVCGERRKARADSHSQPPATPTGATENTAPEAARGYSFLPPQQASPRQLAQRSASDVKQGDLDVERELKPPRNFRAEPRSLSEKKVEAHTEP